MRVLRYLVALLALLAAPAAFAQTAQPEVPGFLTDTGCPSVNLTPCFKLTGPYTANAAVGSNLVLKAAPGGLQWAEAVAGASAGFMMVFDATAAPADGAVTPALCFPVAANALVQTPAFRFPVRFNTGIVVVFSTTGCFTKTASATAFISGIVQ